MIRYVYGDIFDSKCQVLVNPVNCVGVMGKGLAKEFKKRYPKMFKRYKELCDSGLFDIGKLWLYKDSDKWILNFPTKRHWRYPSKLEYIEKGLDKFVATYKEKGIKSIAFPQLGTKNGKLNWEDVKGLMESKLANLPIHIEIYIYNGKEDEQKR